MNTELEARIRTRAYQIWENDPSPDGNADRHWDEARRQLEAEGIDGHDGHDGAESSVDQSAERERRVGATPEELLQEAAGAEAESDANAPVGGRRKR